MAPLAAVLLLVALLDCAAGYNVLLVCKRCNTSSPSKFVQEHIDAIRRVIGPDGVLKVVSATYGSGTSRDDAAMIMREAVGFDHIVTSSDGTEVGMLLASALPNVRVTVNEANKVASTPNFQGIAYREDQLGYLAGVLAGTVSTTRRVACLAGPQYPSLKRFRNGFARGVQSVCQGCIVDGVYALGFAEVEHGRELAGLLVSRGADVVFGAAGQTGNAGIREVAGVQGTLVIGADNDEWYSTFDQDTGAKGASLLTSAMKNLDVAIGESLRDGMTGTFQGGWKLMDLASGGISLAPCHASCNAIRPAAQEALEAAEQEFKRGDRTTGVVFGTGEVAMDVVWGRMGQLTSHYGDRARFLVSPKMMLLGSRLVLLGEEWGEVWWYNVGGNSIDHFQTDSTVPPPRSDFGAVAIGLKGYVFGGGESGSGPFFNDLWLLELVCPAAEGLCGALPQWRRVDTVGSRPSARYAHSMVS
eukprot:Sspe_Gene.119527::Locus_115677_Transcript_1_1_Confidence_1.000_Length_1454::g.119527::m.119527/K07335/bmpA, bmpB, tmpC; basic membrane protein A and related proteins